ncbi:hypothetical protein OX284_000770 [Flavobacterium sp. SUN046]|uniref:hypothetical protein n=1 Tax=Flavobacterium sp. SUN046 TaxID=3002440 RepID=UPI002DB87911|nr:hypothetical protein [Flavobacterium sp. SUN046]MEC4047946.1 hypothetical protein [Flavobacterium sp. SUN046]
MERGFSGLLCQYRWSQIYVDGGLLFVDGLKTNPIERVLGLRIGIWNLKIGI